MDTNLTDFQIAYRQLSLEETGDNLLKDLHKDRKCVALLHKASMEKLDNSSACFLLENKLKNYYEKSRRYGIYEKELDKILARKKSTPFNKVSINLNLSNLDKQYARSCQENGFMCSKSEQVNQKDFENFINGLRTKSSVQNQIPIASGSGHCQKLTMVTSKPPRNIYYGDKQKENREIPVAGSFKTAFDEMEIQNAKKYGQPSGGLLQKKKLGTRRGVKSKFVSPLLSNEDNSGEEIKSDEWPAEADERLKNIEPKMVELIKSEIMDCGAPTHWNDIAGLEFAKAAIQEAVVWPMLRPDIFTGLRRPPKGILLFGPPGTGKTLIGKCVASQSKSTFFSISASSLTSKWIGDGEKMVRALFAVARCHQPAVIFIDEIDSLLSQRSDSEHESSRRIKTEFLVQLDGATTESEERILLIGATNRPQELDEAARRRFVKRLYIPLPEYDARLELLQKLISGERHCLTREQFIEIAKLTDGFSGADIRILCSEASLGPIRSLNISLIEKIDAEEVRPVIFEDFKNALKRVKSSVSSNDLEHYIKWNATYGSGV